MKKALCLLICFMMIVAALPLQAMADGEQVNPFIDVPEGKWYTKAVLYCKEHGYMSGTSDTTFEPNSKVTRAMIVTILWRMAGASIEEYDNPFTDVPAKKWYKNAVLWAKRVGVASGTSETTFSPEDNVTRQQIAVMFMQYTELVVGGDTSARAELGEFTDQSAISSWAKNAVSWAIASGLISGKGNGILDPRGTATRAEVAQIIYKYAAEFIGPLEDLDGYIVKNGRSVYKILVPADASSQLDFAAREFRDFFEMITGARLAIVSEADPEGGKYFSIGNTHLFSDSGLTATYEELGYDGYKVKTVGDSVVMIGENDTSSTYAVYGYLAAQFGLEIYADNCYRIDETPTAEFAEIDLTDLPDIPMRNGGAACYSWYGSKKDMDRLRVRNMQDYWGLITHTYFVILPPSEYLAQHPDWYDDASNPNELCKTNEEMKAQFIENLKQIILNNPDKRYFHLGHEDGEPRCMCANCRAVRNQYGGSNTALEVLFLNEVVRQINAWAAEEIPDRELNFAMMAYTTTEEPPVWNIGGLYFPINFDSRLMLESNLGVQLTPISAHVSTPYMDQTYQSGVYNGWKALTNNFYAWTYCAPFKDDGIIPFDGFSTYAQNIRTYVSFDCKWLFHQGFSGYSHNFMALRDYMTARLMWDSTLDEEALAQDFILHYYGPGASNIYTFYTSWRAYLTQLMNDYGLYSYCANQLVQDWYKPEFFPIGLLDGYDALFEAALASNEAIRDADPEHYEMYRNNIRSDRCLIRYLKLRIHADLYSYDEYKAMVEEFADISNVKGGASVSLMNGLYETLNHKDPNYTEPVVSQKSFAGGCAFSDYSGTIGGVTFEGVKAVSGVYQPHFTFSEYGVNRIKEYAAGDGYDVLVIHSYAELYNNGFIIGGSWTGNHGWFTTEISVSDVSTSFDFWSQSEGATAIYMWFEFKRSPTVNAKCFTGGCSFSDYSGTVDGVTFEGVRVYSSDYQPSFYFSEYGVNRIKSYASENGYDRLIIHSYAILHNNGFVIGERWTGLRTWAMSEIKIADVTASLRFWSQSEGLTEIYLWFEFAGERAIGAESFVGAPGSGMTFVNYVGAVDGAPIDGVRAVSSEYQPHFSFTSDGADRIKEYAAENNYDTLTVHSYAILKDNCFVIGGVYTPIRHWSETDVPISGISGSFDFWSQSQGETEIYMWFEFKNAASVTHNSFVSAPGAWCFFSDYSGTIGGVTFNGVRVQSSEYQPHFCFSEYGVNRITGYAAANGYDTLRIHSYAKLYNNSFLIGGAYTSINTWNVLDVPISKISTSFTFWSQSEGETNIYLWFEFK